MIDISHLELVIAPATCPGLGHLLERRKLRGLGLHSARSTSPGTHGYRIVDLLEEQANV